MYRGGEAGGEAGNEAGDEAGGEAGDEAGGEAGNEAGDEAGNEATSAQQTPPPILADSQIWQRHLGSISLPSAGTVTAPD